MTTDDDFKPRLGRMRSGGGRKGLSYFRRVLQAVAQAGGNPRGSLARSRGGSGRIGRGAGIGHALAASQRQRRVVIKTRIVRLRGNGLDAARLHLRYIQRDGVTRDGQPGQLYSADDDHADGRALLERSADDRHQFRIIVSAEDADQYEDLKDFTRALMRQVEKDLGTRLDWVAVDHYNTGHPHTHIVLRGKDERDRDLVIARDYVAHGMRERAAEIVSFDLGPRSKSEIRDRLRAEVTAERFTSLDRALLREADDGMVRSGAVVGDDDARFHQTLRAGRLHKLRRLGLADEAEPGRWRLSPELEPTLRAMGERGDIIKTMHRALTEARLERGAADLAIFDPAAAARPLVGRVVARGLADEFGDRHYLIVDGIDGRSHWVDIGRGDRTEALPEGALVAITPRRPELRPADRTIDAVANANNGRYDAEAHLRLDPSASTEFAAAHVRRLEALRRAGVVERQPDGGWTIPPDFLERAGDFERSQARAAPVMVEIVSPVPLARQVGADAATWLDRQMIAAEPSAVRDAGFGREVKSALAQRRQWLIDQGA
jgi:type IV secretory pathway VirD2 relaxase